MKRAVSFILSVAMLMTVVACAQSAAATWQEQYDLGVRYLSEGNYREAIITFIAAIEIDPKRADAYISLADAYIAQGDVEQARQVLEDALAVVADTSVIRNRLDGFAGSPVPELTPETTVEPTQETTWQEQYDLGIRYLSKGNYREAIIAFNAAIEIDPQQADGYVRLAEAYIKTNDFENATRVVNQGIDACGESDAFTLLLNQIHVSELLQNGMTDNMLRREELNFFGRNIDTLSFQESIEILQQRGYEKRGDYSNENFVSVTFENTDMLIDVSESSNSRNINWNYTLKKRNAKYLIGIRDINAYDTIANVLTKLGFSNGEEISACIVDIANSEISAALLDSDGSYRALIQKYLSDECTFILSVIPGSISIGIDFDTDYGKYFGKYSYLGLDFGYGYSDSRQDSLTVVNLTYTDIPEPTTYG